MSNEQMSKFPILLLQEWILFRDIHGQGWKLLSWDILQGYSRTGLVTVILGYCSGIFMDRIGNCYPDILFRDIHGQDWKLLSWDILQRYSWTGLVTVFLGYCSGIFMERICNCNPGISMDIHGQDW